MRVGGCGAGLLSAVEVAACPQAIPPIRQEQAFVLEFGGAGDVILTGGVAVGDLLPMDLAALVDVGDQREFLRTIQPLVESLILDRLATLFDDYGVEVVMSPGDLADSQAMFSTIYFAGQRGPEAPDDVFDTVRAGDSPSGQDAPLILYGSTGQANDLGNRVLSRPNPYPRFLPFGLRTQDGLSSLSHLRHIKYRLQGLLPLDEIRIVRLCLAHP